MSGPDYGPRGYLPARAAQRARKIVLREQMGIGWPLAAVVAAVVVLGAGVWFLSSAGRTPGPPFFRLAQVQAIPVNSSRTLRQPGSDVRYLVVRTPAAVRVFEDPRLDVGWCAASGRLEGARGRVWTADGALVGGGGDSLRPLRTTVHGGAIYVDDTTDVPRPPPQPRGEEPACR